MELTDSIKVVLEAARRPMTVHEIVRESQPHVAETISPFDVSQICMSLFHQELVRLENANPLMFCWRE